MSKERDRMYEYFNEFKPLIWNNEQEYFARNYMPKYIFRLSRKKNTECICSECESHFEMQNTKSGESAVCPVCGAIGTYRVMTNNSYFKDKIKIYDAVEHDGKKALFLIKNYIEYRLKGNRVQYTESTYFDAFTILDDKRYFYKRYSAYGHYPDFHPLGDNYCWDAGYVTERCGKIFPSMANAVGNLLEVDKYLYFTKPLESEIRPNSIPIHFFNVSSNMQGVLKKVMPTYQWAHTIAYSKIDTDEQTIRAITASGIDPAEVDELLNYMSVKKIVNYLIPQSPMQKYGYSRTPREYIDYINIAKNMDMDMTKKRIRYPEDIHAARQLVIYAKSQKEIEVFQAKARELFKNAKSLYSCGGLSVIMPTTKEEFVAEGMALNHCVGKNPNYYESHMAGTKMIFFIRRTHEIAKPFVTMQLDMRTNKILQIYGFNDTLPAEEVRGFAELFASNLANCAIKVA